jgi:RNA-directed DNA polymerase
VRFNPPGENPPVGPPPAAGPPTTFDLLGFTHHWARSRRGSWYVQRETAKGRFTRALKQIAQWCRTHRHDPIGQQHRVLTQKLRGHDAYYGITGNGKALARLHHEVRKIWRRWLARRGGKRSWTWERYEELLRRFPLPAARVVHSYLRPCAANP